MRLFVILLLIVLIGCEKYDEFKCDQYYITKETHSGNYMTNYYYNKDGAIDRMTVVNGDSMRTYLFHYHDQRLEEVISADLQFRKKFFYDSNDRLIAITLPDDADVVTDSLAIENDAQGRMIKRSHYKNGALQIYSVGKYSGDNL